MAIRSMGIKESVESYPSPFASISSPPQHPLLLHHCFMIAPYGPKEKIRRGDHKTIAFGASAATRALHVDEDDQQTVIAANAAPI